MIAIRSRNQLLPAAAGTIAAAIFVWMAGCSSDANPPTATGTGATTQPVTSNIFGPIPQTGGAQLWAENCTRCHNAPPPDRFSSAQWDIIVHHMRLRADLTGEEQREITKFLQASH